MTNFEIFSQPVQPVGELDHSIYKVFFPGTAVRALFLVLVDSHSSRVGILQRYFFLGFLLYEECFEKC